MKKWLRKIHWIVSEQFGVNLRRMGHSLRGVPRYLVTRRRFRRSYNGCLGFLPCLYDWYEEGGTARGEYFWQDLYVARRIFDAGPVRHVDIGSRIDGFVAHVASFREIEVFDVRPVSAKIPGLIFRQADFTAPKRSYTEYCDSLSCLHALEHFGLGRYGDPVDPEGYIRGFCNMAAMVKTGGHFYLSVPVGIKRVEFNGHWVFDPRELLRQASECGLQRTGWARILTGEPLVEPKNQDQDIEWCSQQDYVLGIFTFSKL